MKPRIKTLHQETARFLPCISVRYDPKALRGPLSLGRDDPRVGQRVDPQGAPIQLRHRHPLDLGEQAHRPLPTGGLVAGLDRRQVHERGHGAEPPALGRHIGIEPREEIRLLVGGQHVSEQRDDRQAGHPHVDGPMGGVVGRQRTHRVAGADRVFAFPQRHDLARRIHYGPHRGAV